MKFVPTSCALVLVALSACASGPASSPSPAGKGDAAECKLLASRIALYHQLDQEMEKTAENGNVEDYRKASQRYEKLATAFEDIGARGNPVLDLAKDFGSHTREMTKAIASLERMTLTSEKLQPLGETFKKDFAAFMQACQAKKAPECVPIAEHFKKIPGKVGPNYMKRLTQVVEGAEAIRIQDGALKKQYGDVVASLGKFRNGMGEMFRDQGELTQISEAMKEREDKLQSRALDLCGIAKPEKSEPKKGTEAE